MATSLKFSPRHFLVIFLTITINICAARSTFNSQELQDLWPFLQRYQVSNNIPGSAVDHAFPERYEEPSSRNLDIGFSVGERDKDEDSVNDINKAVEENKNFYQKPGEGYGDEPKGNELSIDVFADSLKETLPSYEVQGGRFGVQRNPIPQEDEPLSWREDWIPRPGYKKVKYWVPTTLVDRDTGERMTVDNGRYFAARPVPLLNDEAILRDERQEWNRRHWVRTPPADRDTAERMMVDNGRYPVMIPQRLINKVGTMKLKSDRGYQLAMHVPPASTGDRPGVLELDMKATLYRPIYY